MHGVIPLSLSARPVTLPGQKRDKRKARNGLTAQDRTILPRVIAILESGQSSKFQFEAACRHGLRSSFCLAGINWAKADARASAIVTEALRRIGAERPTWQMAQPEWTADGFAPIERTRCAHCGGTIPPDRTERGSRFGKAVIYCSILCVQAAAAKRARLSGEQLSRAEHLARCAARRERTLAAEIECKHCGKPFRPGYNIHRHQFCSKACADAGKTNPRRLAERACVGCGGMFKPKHGTSKYCSPACYQGRGESPNRGVERTCPVCQSVFRVHSAKLETATCSRTCGAMRRRQAAIDVT